MTRGELVDNVRLKIDEVSSQASVIVDVGVEENNPTDTMIDGLLDESARELLLSAPFIYLPISDGRAKSYITERSGKNGVITLPADFIRPVCLQMSDWRAPLYLFELAGSLVANRQKNPYLQGGANKPIAILSHTPEGYKISYYGTNALHHSIKKLDYIAECKAEEITNKTAIDSLCWVTASKVLGIAQDVNAATLAMERAKALLK